MDIDWSRDQFRGKREVRPSLRQIVQARGRFNRTPEPREVLALQAWATRNKLQPSMGRW
jgi:hypothetical protein